MTVFADTWPPATAHAGFFFPVLLFMFGGPGVYFVNLTKSDTRFYNVFLWLMLSVGNALLMVLYSREWFSRYGEHPVQYPVRGSLRSACFVVTFTIRIASATLACVMLVCGYKLVVSSLVFMYC